MTADRRRRTQTEAVPPASASRVVLLVWRIPPARLLRVFWRLARDRRALRTTPGVGFAKLVGTGPGRRFGPGRVDPSRWAAVISWDPRAGDVEQAPAIAAWGRLATSRLRLDLTPVAVHGQWAGREPFTPRSDRSPEGIVLALTRARLRPSRAVAFWRAIGPAALAADRASGLLATFGFGEAPIGWQGTVSVWRTERDLVEFAYRHPDHRRVIDESQARRWYGEELFARFAVDVVHGDRRLIGWAVPETAAGTTTRPDSDPARRDGAEQMRIVPWTPADLTRRLDDVVSVYGQAMGYPPSLLASRRGYIASHVHRRGFRAVASVDVNGVLLGFGYGYTSEPGQWWHDQVRGAITAEQQTTWLTDCFEVVELHVRPEAQGHGLGAAQLRMLLTMATGTTTLLSTPEADEATSRAWRLYRRFGFVDVLRNFSFPGDMRPFAVLGRTLPLPPAAP